MISQRGNLIYHCILLARVHFFFIFELIPMVERQQGDCTLCLKYFSLLQTWEVLKAAEMARERHDDGAWYKQRIHQYHRGANYFHRKRFDGTVLSPLSLSASSHLIPCPQCITLTPQPFLFICSFNSWCLLSRQDQSGQWSNTETEKGSGWTQKPF